MNIQQPTPKFHLFQRIETKDGIATIIGIEYVAPVRALLLQSRKYGFSYRISHSFNASIEELVKACPDPDSLVDEYWEDELLKEVEPCNS